MGMGLLLSRRGPGWVRELAARLAVGGAAARKVGIGDLSAMRLVQLSLAGALRRMIVAPLSIPATLDLASQYLDLTTAAQLRLEQQEDPSFSTELRSAIVTATPASSGHRAVALRVVAASADRLAPQDGRVIFEW